MALILQDEVTGIMISEFVSREFGYGLALTDEDIISIRYTILIWSSRRRILEL